MPFCPSCGAPFNSGEKFCMQCGKAIDENRKIVPQKPSKVSNVYESGMRSRVEAANEVARMIDYFSPLQAKYDEYDYCSEKIDKCTCPLRVAPVVWGVILTFMGGYVVGTLLYDKFFGTGQMFDQMMSSAEYIPLIIICCILLAVGLFLIIFRIAKVIFRKQSYKKYASRQIELATELREHYRNYGKMCIVGEEYTNPRILELIGNVLRQGRADTVKEAINILIEDAHRSLMELKADLQLQADRQAAAGASAAAVFSAARFFIGGISHFL